jgi:hypothetical protein
MKATGFGSALRANKLQGNRRGSSAVQHGDQCSLNNHRAFIPGTFYHSFLLSLLCSAMFSEAFETLVLSFHQSHLIFVNCFSLAMRIHLCFDLGFSMNE